MISGDFVNKYAHKFVISLGLLATDSKIGQTGVGDRGGIKILIQYMKEYDKISPTLAKWGCWALSNLALSHPPNKREIVHQGRHLTLPLIHLRIKLTAFYFFN